MNEWVWSNGGMILTGENRNIGRKISAISHFSLFKLNVDRPGIEPRRVTAVEVLFTAVSL